VHPLHEGTHVLTQQLCGSGVMAVHILQKSVLEHLWFLASAVIVGS
jgi:surface polysaccharide O-acyltransferase-like enzyme